MKRTIIALIILAVLAGGSLTAFFAVKSRRDKEKAEESSVLSDYDLFRFDSDSINRITIESEGEEYIAELGDDGDGGTAWKMANTDDFSANQTYFQSICTYMSDLTAEKDYGEADDAKRAEYGLDDPVVITAEGGGEKYTVSVGDPSPTGDVYYVTVTGKTKIYAIDTLYGSVLKTSRTMMKSKDMIPYDDDEIARIRLSRGGKLIYDLRYDDSGKKWSLPAEYDRFTTDLTEITAMINLMTRVEAQNFFDESLEDYSKYGFDKPYAELVVDGLDGTERKLLYSHYGDDTNTYTYVLFEETGQVVQCYTGDVGFIEYDYPTFLIKTVCPYNINDITGFDVTYGGETTSFETQGDDSVKMDGKEVNTIGDTAAGIFSKFYISLTAAEFTGLDMDAKPPEDAETLMAVKFRTADGGEKTFEFEKRDDKTCYVIEDGEYTGAYIDSENLDAKNKSADLLGQLRDL